MNIEVLRYLESDGREHVEEKVQPTKYDSEATFAVIKILIANDGNADALSDKQKFHLKTFVEPLINRVPCSGIYGEDTCTGDGFVDDESLLMSYQEDDFMCQHCRYDAENRH
ncbi:hypothetical protein [Enterobacter hormaechei]|uniref:hypothetical protein n=1 Tax=Enterobacter hormaechei TaxID=158836 RepID=UPI000735154C|nr:hypothetical protein [Enterobacter hormaechei]HAS1749970.1 hypothetical protein [Enterobacter hormaechei subsp. oharae]KTG93665.1 hypothetical protein ASV34_16050 [Enterobacter hormaechei subsp. xiangfangensis]KTG98716.1 hypothetical protein ASV33_16010 [Enterobacter hormaechei subsp. xiangfangensis]KTH98074.1 hypothetical protein ASV12_05435 [Enterobacter hormaechei subsp. xiangfangensis]KTI87841.1 hypothetical protein ASU94_14665 [Enterobacter hormaechei subsp. xiangfangensis]